MWKTFVQKKIVEEDQRISYRSKLRKPTNCFNHQRSLTSDCAVCRKLYWVYHEEQCIPKIAFGMINVPKSEAR